MKRTKRERRTDDTALRLPKDSGTRQQKMPGRGCHSGSGELDEAASQRALGSVRVIAAGPK